MTSLINFKANVKSMGCKGAKKGITMDLILVLNSYNWNTKINFKIVYTGYKQINSK